MINLSMPEIEVDLRPRITVFGVGGAGGNAVNNMIKSNLEGVEFVVANTDAQALKGSHAEKRIQLGTTITRGLGAGSRPDVGRAAAEEQLEEIMGHLHGANMAFITAGMGGGTGTGAAPVIARAAREQGILTVGVVTKPFHFEGAHRMRLAEAGIQELQQYVDTLIIIPNQNLFRIANEKTTFADAFKMADDVLHSGVRGVTDLMIMPGLINLDFADIRSVMTEMGKAMMGTGEATGDRRAVEAAEAAISNPLLDDVSMKGAKGVLINITGGMDMTLFEVDEAANRIRDEVDPDANIIFGSTFDQNLEGVMRVSVVATGIDHERAVQPRPAAATLHVVGGTRKPAAGPVGAVVHGRQEAVRSGLDYHHTLAPAPLHPSHATVGATAQKLDLAQHEPAPQYEPQPEAVHPAPQPMPQPAPQSALQPTAYSEPARAQQPASGGPLRGERRDGAFIAPRPADAGPRATMPAPAAAPDSFGPAPSSEPRARRSSLFERVTGLGRRIMEGSEPGDPAVRQQAQTSAPRSAAPAPQPQQRLAADPMERPRMSSPEEDLLDIPAFLRRQAN
ncbi:cell division protein FtsZ [Arenibaculum sp.]|jgi:cell division protein FtsZ|uniref:cell division protein FtsZ n=1 Tax=Arenibaculum sp. TaxID=2865862 RepID=UPI002E15833E|nr:cell division protein FtsZ [Arenibaculum sp.]